MNKSQPLVSVIMPAYNADVFIVESIQSMIKQSYKNWELIIINDGSIDRTAELVSELSSKDSRIKLIDNKENKGIVASRNVGIETAKGKFIANLDSDDIAKKNRLTEQVIFLENNSDFTLIGSACEVVDAEGKVLTRIKRDIPNDHIPCLLLFSNYFINSSIMMKANIAKKIRYENDIQLAEDYNLFVAFSQKGKIGNINKSLVQYRSHENNISKEKETELNQAIKVIQKKQLSKFNISISETELEIHTSLVDGIYHNKNISLDKVEKWLVKLVESNKIEKIYPSHYFNYYCAFFFRRACENTKLKNKPLQQFRRSVLSQFIKNDFKGNSAFFVKTILKSL